MWGLEVTPTPHGLGWAPVPAKMSKRYAEWSHADHGLTVVVCEARPTHLLGPAWPASVYVMAFRRLTDADAEFVRDAFGLVGGRVRWTPNRKGRECSIVEVTQ